MFKLFGLFYTTYYKVDTSYENTCDNEKCRYKLKDKMTQNWHKTTFLTNVLMEVHLIDDDAHCDVSQPK